MRSAKQKSFFKFVISYCNFVKSCYSTRDNYTRGVYMKCNTAIFYDIKNLIANLGDKASAGLNLDEIHNQVLALDGVDGVSVQRAYADWAEPANRGLWGLALQVGIEPVQVFALSPEDDVKNVANVNLVIDAVDLIAKNPEIANYVIASGDGVFTFLVKKLREHGKRVIGCGFESDGILQKSVSEFVSLGKATSAKPNLKQLPVRKAPIVVEVNEEESAVDEDDVPIVKTRKRRRLSEKQPVRFPDNEYSTTLFESDISVIRDGAITPLPECLHTVKEMVKALFSKPTRDSAGVSVKDFIVYMKHYLRGFKITDHGFKRIETFLKFVLTGSPYCLYTVDEMSFIALRRKVKDDTIADDVQSLSVTTPDGKRYSSIFDVPGNESFVYSYSDSKRPRTVRGRGTTGSRDGRVGRKRIVATHNIDLQVPLRGWAKAQFENLAQEDALSLTEARKLKEVAYSKETFGINVPCFLEIETSRNLDEQRTVNGKLRYWKEIFRFNGRTYLIYKDWIDNLHKDRFLNWFASLSK